MAGGHKTAYIWLRVGFNSQGAYMYTYPNITQQIVRKTTTTTKTYDEENRLITEKVCEEIEYAAQPATLPNTPWIVTNTANTAHLSHVHSADPTREYVEYEPGGHPK